MDNHQKEIDLEIAHETLVSFQLSLGCCLPVPLGII